MTRSARPGQRRRRSKPTSSTNVTEQITLSLMAVVGVVGFSWHYAIPWPDVAAVSVVGFVAGFVLWFEPSLSVTALFNLTIGLGGLLVLGRYSENADGIVWVLTYTLGTRMGWVTLRKTGLKKE